MTVLLSADQVSPESDLDPLELAVLVEDLANDPRSWRHLIQREPGQYWSTCLFRDRGVSAWLIGWPQNMRTELHHHGPAATALTVVEGRLIHALASEGQQRQQLLHEPLATGTLLTVGPHATHALQNRSEDLAISIHAYSPLSENLANCHRPAAEPTAERLTPREAYDAQRSGAILVDLRSQGSREFEGCIPGALVLSGEEANRFFKPRGGEPARSAQEKRLVIFVCDEGHSSRLSAASLLESGVAGVTGCRRGLSRLACSRATRD